MEKLTLIFNLQWLLFKNSLRSQTSKIELIGRIIFFIGSAIVDVGIAVVLFIATLSLYNRPNANTGFILLFSAITLYWQMMPLLTASFGGGLSISNFRRYPVSDNDLLLLDLISGATDITSLSIYLPLLGIFIASVILNPFYSPIIIIIFLLFILFNIALSRYLQRVIEKLLAHRRIKEFLVFIAMLFLLSFSIIPILVFRQEIKEKHTKQVSPKEQTIKTLPKFSLKEKLPSSQQVVQVLSWSPPGLVGRSVINLPKESFIKQLLMVFLSILFSGLIILLVKRKINYEFYGSEAKFLLANETTANNSNANISRDFSHIIFDNKLMNLLPLHSVMIFEKEIKYFYRSSKTLLIFITGTMSTVFFPFIFQAQRPTENSSFFAQFMLPGLNFYSLMILGQFFANSFGFDSHGVKTFFLMPTEGKNVLLGKNLAVALITLLQTTFTAILFHYLVYPINSYILLNTIFCSTIALLAYIILGNFLSIFYPQKMDFSTLSDTNYSKMGLLLLALMQGFVFCMLAVAPVLAWYSKLAWITFPVFAIELIVILSLYKISLKYAGKFFEKRVEEFLQTLL